MTGTTETTDQVEDISLNCKTVQVRLNGKKHVIVSANSDVATEYRNITLKHVSMKDGVIEGKLMGLAEAEPFLVSKCVFMLDANDARHAYSLDDVKQWDNSAVKKLHTMIKAISDLDEKGAEKAKNVQ